MPEPESEPDRAPAGTLQRLRTDRRWRLGAAAGALALILVVTIAVTLLRKEEPGGIADGPLKAAPAGADRVPAGRIIEKLPHNCGVSDGTAARLAPGSDRDAEKGGVFREGGPGNCQWYSLDDGKATCDFCVGDFRNERVLDVGIALADGRLQSPISEAMRLIDNAARGGATAAGGTPRIVTGLGEEATARYSAESRTEGAIVVFREGNAVVTVRYKGWDRVRGKEKVISERTALDGAFAAAAETAKSMGAPARPATATAVNPVTPPLTKIPKPCDAVPAGTVDRVARDAYRRRGGALLLSAAFQPGLEIDACRWQASTSRYADEGRSRTLSVAVAAETAPGRGALSATRHFLGLYRNLRAGTTPGVDDFTGFKPLAGPGERAFAVTRSDSQGDMGVVLFQKRNVLVEVSYGGADGETKLSGPALVDAAYTVAVAAERSLR